MRQSSPSSSTKSNELDAMISKCIGEIWSKYDFNSSGYLEKSEAKRLVQDTIDDMSQGYVSQGCGSQGSGQPFINERDFEECFKKFDRLNSGTIKMSSMV